MRVCEASSARAMNLNIIITVISYIIQSASGHFGISNELTSKTHVNREELIDFINSLNDGENQINTLTSNNLDPVGEEKKEEKLKEILWLLKKNYDAYKHHAYLEKNPLQAGARLYLIKNPDVLDEYTTYLKKKKLAVSASVSDLSEQEIKLKSIKDLLQSLRRNSQIALRKPGRNNDNFSDENLAREPDSEKVINKKVDNDWDKVGLKKDSESREDKRVEDKREKKYDNDWEDEKPLDKYPKYQDDWNKRDSYKNKYESSDRERWDRDRGSREFKKSMESPRNKYRDSYGGRERGAGIGRQRERSYPQGRTPIPIVGKRGIYENE